MEFLVGAVIVAVLLFDVFQSVVMPRWTSRTLRVAPRLVDFIWPQWKRAGFRMREGEHREDFLGTFGPLVLMLILVMWVLGLIFGYGLMIHALRDQIRPPINNWSSAFYLAGTSLLTIGYGDFVATGGAARVVVLVAGAGGLAVVALVISLIFTLYGSFQRREVLVLTLDARAGSPPSGVTLLETYARFGMLDELPATFREWENWAAEVLESHRAYPVLPYFRSSHDNESWVGALGAVLDAATLMITTVDAGPDDGDAIASDEVVGDEVVGDEDNEAVHIEEAERRRLARRARGAAHMMHGLGTHAVLDLGHWFGLPRGNEPGVEQIEFHLARGRLSKAGYVLREADQSWRDFREMRALYATPLNAMARHFATPPTQWIGDRSDISYIHRHVEHLTQAGQAD